jgi:nucleoside-diphosphate-sugar epimerase
LRVIVVGGTRFVGRALVHELVGSGHEVLLAHRGMHEATELPDVPHLHVARRDLAGRRADLRAFGPDALVDVSAMTGSDAEAALEAVGTDLRLVVVSSIDVYRAYTSVWTGEVTDPVPLDERSVLRSAAPPDRDYVMPGYDYDPEQYEKLDVERAYLARGATVCRLPMVYGQHDYKRREEFVLRRVRAGRRRIPVGSGSWLWSRGCATDLAVGLRLALESDAAVGEVFNLCESHCASVRLWAEQILAAAGWEAELVGVPEESLPEDLEITGSFSQHWLADATKARELLGWVHSPSERAVERSVRWHLEHPPNETGDFGADEAALTAGRG